MRRAQVSVEYLIITAFTFLLLIPLLSLYYIQSQAIRQEFTESQLETVGINLRDAAQRVYFAGTPSRETVRVRIPLGVASFNVTSSSIFFRTKEAPVYDIITGVLVPLIPTTLNSSAGDKDVRVEATMNGVLLSIP